MAKTPGSKKGKTQAAKQLGNLPARETDADVRGGADGINSLIAATQIKAQDANNAASKRRP